MTRSRMFLFVPCGCQTMPPGRTHRLGAKASRRKSMAWHILSVLSSAKTLLRKKHKGDFSPIQKIVAAVHYYAQLPVDDRLQLAWEYAEPGLFIMEPQRHRDTE